MINTNTTYVIESASAARVGGTCTLGQGPTEKAAWEDAIGPKPWTSWQKKTALRAWCRKLEEGEEVSYNE